jgi:hypothetical protein
MSEKYKTEAEVLRLVESFETATIARDEWRHAEHLVVALYYLSNHDFETSLGLMRSGIFKLLKAFEVDLSVEMPYHETMTVFWMRTVDDFKRLKNGASMSEICRAMIERFDKDYPLRFYSRELLFSDEARARFVEPDLQKF